MSSNKRSTKSSLVAAVDACIPEKKVKVGVMGPSNEVDVDLQRKYWDALEEKVNQWQQQDKLDYLELFFKQLFLIHTPFLQLEFSDTVLNQSNLMEDLDGIIKQLEAVGEDGIRCTTSQLLPFVLVPLPEEMTIDSKAHHFELSFVNVAASLQVWQKHIERNNLAQLREWRSFVDTQPQNSEWFLALQGVQDVKDVEFLLSQGMPAKRVQILTQLLYHGNVQLRKKPWVKLLNSMKPDKDEKLMMTYLEQWVMNQEDEVLCDEFQAISDSWKP